MELLREPKDSNYLVGTVKERKVALALHNFSSLFPLFFSRVNTGGIVLRVLEDWNELVYDLRRKRGAKR